MKQRDLYYERIPTKLLREDIRLLGTFLGRVIKDQEGKTFYKIVEKLRLLSKNTLLYENKNKVFIKISKEVKKLRPKQTFKITRAFSHILNLMNLAESLDASRKLNEYDNPYFKNKNQNLFIEDIIEGLFKNKKISNNERDIMFAHVASILGRTFEEIKQVHAVQIEAKTVEQLKGR